MIKTVNSMGFSVRTANALKRNNIFDEVDLRRLTRDKLVRMRGVGRVTLEEILSKCKELGIEVK